MLPGHKDDGSSTKWSVSGSSIAVGIPEIMGAGYFDDSAGGRTRGTTHIRSGQRA